MSGILTYRDGRIRTGRVASLIFVLMFFACALFFKISPPVDKAVVVVEHLFKPAKPLVKKEINRTGVKKQADVVPGSGEVPTARAEKEKCQGEEPIADKSEVIHAKAEQAGAGLKENKDLSDLVSSGEFESEAKALEPVEPSKRVIAAGQSESLKNKNLSKTNPNKDPDDAGTARLIDQKEMEFLAGKTGTVRTLEYKKDVKLESLPDVSSWAENEERAKSLEVSSLVDSFKDKAETFKSQVHWLKAKGADEQANKGKQTDTKADRADIKPLSHDRGERSVTVDRKDYRCLMGEWQKSGKQKKLSLVLPLQVRNLRNSYELFQMKPVAVLRNGTCIDLADRTRIQPKSLEGYSSTVFLVDRPWDKWRATLEAVGVKPSDNFEVRYYMYDFVRDAIYARAGRAFDWCRETGALDKETAPGKVDVQGIACIIRQEGGGRFGVFVPVTVKTEKGGSIKVDLAACFAGERDVEVLRTAGLL